MCRLIGFVSPAPSTLTAQVGAEQVARFRDLSCLHGDGWGSAWVEPGERDFADNTIRSYRTTQRAPDDPIFTEVVDSHRSVARLVHLRWATEGLSITDQNTHPFVADGLALAHNGSITPRSDLAEMLTPEMLQSLRGGTDSERYLAVIRQELATATDLPEAVARAVSRLRQRFPAASLNALLLSGTTFIAVHASAASPAPLEDMLASLPVGVDEAALPLEHLESYFLMRCRTGQDGSLVFSSTGLQSDGWEPLPPESVTAIDLATMRTSVRELVPR
ncbi:MAG TPA: class II glutamine amidotransferase [Jatrophihabitans sp.]|jgi:predicted glutamine amidotransferase